MSASPDDRSHTLLSLSLSPLWHTTHAAALTHSHTHTLAFLNPSSSVSSSHTRREHERGGPQGRSGDTRETFCWSVSLLAEENLALSERRVGLRDLSVITKRERFALRA
jgi:hypothetical protein